MTTKGQKKLARRLQRARGYSYQAALNELRQLPTWTDWTKYVERVEWQTHLQRPKSGGDGS